MNYRIVAGVISAACLLVGVPTASACSSDNECKGDRICDNQVCSYPKQTAPAAGACRADVDCPASNLCMAGVCTPAAIPPPAAIAPPAVVPPPAVETPPPPPASADAWQYGLHEPPPRPLTPPVMRMRSPRLRNAGITLVTLGVAMEVIGIAVLASSSNGACAGPPQVSTFNAASCNAALSAGSLLMVFAIPIIANGAWMWPVGGAMVPRWSDAQVTLKPLLTASRDGGELGLRLTF